jgi:hypothetical protein
MLKNKTKTIFMDIDGCLTRHAGNLTNAITTKPRLLPGVVEKFNEWDAKGYNIVITTGRRESCREETETLLKGYGLFWDMLIMGLGSGQRVLINDLKPGFEEDMAIAINLTRDSGLGSIDV